MNELGPENGQIAQRVGVWDVTETTWDAPNTAPVVTTGLVAERRMMGSLLQEFIRPPADAAGKDIKRTDMLTFNRVEGRWDYVSFDTRVAAGLMPAWSSERGDGAAIELTFAPFAVTGPEPEVTGQMLRMEQVIVLTAADHDQKDQYFTAADGTGTKRLLHRYTYVRRLTRKPDAAPAPRFPDFLAHVPRSPRGPRQRLPPRRPRPARLWLHRRARPQRVRLHLRPPGRGDRRVHRRARADPLRALRLRLRRAGRLPPRHAAPRARHRPHLAKRQRLPGGPERGLEPDPCILEGPQRSQPRRPARAPAT